MAKRLLVIIDAQNDFTHLQGNYASRHTGISQIAEAKTKIKRLLNSFGSDETVFIRSDYQPGQFGAGLSICIPNTFGHEIDAEFQVDGVSKIITKTEHSCFSSAAFKELLSKAETGTLCLCGFLAEYCVKETAVDALRLGYNVLLLEDCIATGDDVQPRKQQALAELKSKGAAVVKSDHLY